jgi:hypothetical protein
MKTKLCIAFALLWYFGENVNAQSAVPPIENSAQELPHSILPSDGIVEYMPNDTSYDSEEPRPAAGKVLFSPLANFFFRPEFTKNYKEAGMRLDTGNYNFYLRGNFGGKIALPKNIDIVINLQSFGTYTRSLGPLDPNMSLYEAYVDMKNLDRNNRLSLRFGRMSLGKYGTEILVGDDDFTRGRSFEGVRLRYQKDRLTSDLFWVQLYQAAPDSAGIDWNHPLLVGFFNTLHFSEAVNLDAHLPFLSDQYNS